VSMVNDGIIFYSDNLGSNPAIVTGLGKLSNVWASLKLVYLQFWASFAILLVTLMPLTFKFSLKKFLRNQRRILYFLCSLHV